MACISFNNLQESEFDNIVSKRDKVQALNNIQLQLQVHDIQKKIEKLTTNFEPTGNSDDINKIYLDAKKKVIFFILKKITTNSIHNTTNNL